MHGNFRFDRDGGAGDLAVAAILAADFPGGDGLGVAAIRWRVVAEAIERVLAGVEAAGTGFYLAFVLEGFSHLKLKAATGEVLIEAFIGSDFCF